MDTLNILEKEIYKVLTENGDECYETTTSYNLDYFSLVGGMRHNHSDLLKLFLKAYYENKNTALKLLFYTRDILNGLGERNSFRLLFNYLCNFDENVAIKIMPLIFKYGRIDDIFSSFNTKVEKYALSLIKDKLEEDITLKNQGKKYSLLAKWLPSINTSSCEQRERARKIARYLGLSNEEYRKMLTSLRKDMIVENNLREKDYSFDYSKISSGSLYKYKDAFLRNDNERYSSFINNALEKKDINVKSIYPYQIVRDITNSYRGISKNEITFEKRKVLNATWEGFKKQYVRSNTIVVRDGSYSMYTTRSPRAIDVATSLSILFSEMLTGPFKDTFITFSKDPKLVKVNGSDIYEKVINTLLYNEAENTDISKVYDIVFNVSKKAMISESDAIDNIVIISDMEFDEAVEGESTYEIFKNKFESIGLKLPKVVFWNVNARSIHFPVMKDDNVILVSGASKNIINMITNSELTDSYIFMMKTLEKYSEIDELII